MRPLEIFLVLLTGAMAQTSALAATRHVSVSGTDSGTCEVSPCATVSYALDQAVSGDSIRIGAGTFTEPAGIHIEHSVSLEGVGRGAPNATVLQAHAEPGLATDRVITVDGGTDVVIADLVIRHGVARGVSSPHNQGGGLYRNGNQGTLTLDNVDFRANEARVGGRLYVRDGQMLINTVVFSDNIASGTNFSGVGGGLFLGVGTLAELTNVGLYGNLANGDGGGLRMWGGAAILVNGVFFDNARSATAVGCSSVDRARAMRSLWRCSPSRLPTTRPANAAVVSMLALPPPSP